jgi:hypothetical protein
MKKPQDVIFLAGETIPFGEAIAVPRGLAVDPRRVAAVIEHDGLETRIAAAAVMFGGLASLVWLALSYVAAL